MANHTPGPWEIRQVVNPLILRRDHWIYDLTGWVITKHVYGRNTVEAGANIRLIAAAPDLLEALKATFAQPIENGAFVISIGSDIWHNARAVIAKAEGR